MLPLFLILLLAAIGSIVISRRASHEISRVLAISSAIFCSIFAFAMAPWPVQILIFVLILQMERLYPWHKRGEVAVTISPFSPYRRR